VTICNLNHKYFFLKGFYCFSIIKTLISKKMVLRVSSQSQILSIKGKNGIKDSKLIAKWFSKNLKNN